MGDDEPDKDNYPVDGKYDDAKVVIKWIKSVF